MEFSIPLAFASPSLRPLPRDPNSRKKFTANEDAILTCLVGQFGHLGWDVIASHMPGRNSRQCRERWKHYLSVGFTDEPWTKSEDALLLEKKRELGPRWTKISRFFERRSDIQVKARWTKLNQREQLALTRSGAADPSQTLPEELLFTDLEDKFDDGSAWGLE
jgi:hypothetical protein